MSKRFLFALVALGLGLQACNNQAADQKNPNQADTALASPADAAKNTGAVANSDLTYNPATADQPLNENEAAKFEFKEMEYDFGTIKQGDKVEHVFEFKNVGKQPLAITNALGSCGCTVPEYPKEPIAPGQSGKIKVIYDSTGKKGAESKYVTITASNVIGETRLKITANVQEK